MKRLNFMNLSVIMSLIPVVVLARPTPGAAAQRPYVVTDTGQKDCYAAAGGVISPPALGEELYGQDAQYRGPQMAFRDNADGTVTDLNTRLMWQKGDSGHGMNWAQALSYAETLTLAGHDDWRLPNARELQSIVDYTRAPDAVDLDRRGPALDPLFEITEPETYFWTSTTHLEAPGRMFGAQAVYICFGCGMGWMGTPGTSQKRFINVHGAGAQRSDPKVGDPRQFPQGRGPQGDDIRINNFVRCVRGGEVAASALR